MIPKVIHYVWLGGKELPPIAKKCIASWQKYCPDYEIKRWDETNLDLDKYQFVKDAMKAKKYAFASDVFRTDIIHKHGGIYLDIDVELVKPIDELLSLDCFMGFSKYGRFDLSINGRLFRRVFCQRFIRLRSLENT